MLLILLLKASLALAGPPESTFAVINAQNIVVNVLVATKGYTAKHSAAAEFTNRGVPCGAGCFWQETSPDGTLTKHYGAPGYTYDSVKKDFISPKPYPSWALNDKNEWAAPVPEPVDDKLYRWNEAAQKWLPIKKP